MREGGAVMGKDKGLPPNDFYSEKKKPAKLKGHRTLSGVNAIQQNSPTEGRQTRRATAGGHV